MDPWSQNRIGFKPGRSGLIPDRAIPMHLPSNFGHFLAKAVGNAFSVAFLVVSVSRRSVRCSLVFVPPAALFLLSCSFSSPAPPPPLSLSFLRGVSLSILSSSRRSVLCARRWRLVWCARVAFRVTKASCVLPAVFLEGFRAYRPCGGKEAAAIALRDVLSAGLAGQSSVAGGTILAHTHTHTRSRLPGSLVSVGGDADAGSTCSTNVRQVPRGRSSQAFGTG